MGTATPRSPSDYDVIRTLGTGSTGKVRLARCSKTGELVALKIISKDVLGRKRNLSTKVRREIAIMKLIASDCLTVEKKQQELIALLPEPGIEYHVGLMKLVEVLETEHSFVLVLEYCDGGELFDLLIELGRLPEKQVLDLFQQLVYALEFCHRRGICHRDLKPENVLLMRDGRVKLADFGMASRFTRESLLGTSCGSPQYCAPEVIVGDAYDGRAADIWSLGITLYAMTTGGLPFNDDNHHRLNEKINAGVFHMPPEVPNELAALIRLMLVVDPLKRATLSSVKQSEWFQSFPCRKDVYREEDESLIESIYSSDDEFSEICPSWSTSTG